MGIISGRRLGLNDKPYMGPQTLSTPYNLMRDQLMSEKCPFGGGSIYYHDEQRSEWNKFLYGSSIHGGGFMSAIGPILMICGGAVILWALLTHDVEKLNVDELIKIEQMER